MYIYIDESGLFIPTEVEEQTSSVGALVVPDNAVSEMESALQTLKVEIGVGVDKEIKRPRPDCQSIPFEDFIAKLNHLGCTLHVISTSGGPLQGERLEKHRESTKQAILRFAGIENKSQSLCEEVCSLIDNLSSQQFSQCILQTYLISELIEKVIPYYAKLSPESLEKFIWEFDRKDFVETTFERVFKYLYIGRVQATSSINPLPLIQSPDRNYGYFFRSFAANHGSNEKAKLQNIATLCGGDLSHIGDALGTFEVSSLLANSFSLVDSRDSLGVQIADLLVSSVNRCIKGNYTDNEKMASLLGKLMINSPKRNVRAVSLMGFSETRPLGGLAGKVINIMDDNSNRLFSEVFISNRERYLK
ncbi:DUF3800 domain-containing protein [Vibrio splendidus]|nr:hypothetical protein BCU89_26255 [Vibrio splendidus]